VRWVGGENYWREDWWACAVGSGDSGVPRGAGLGFCPPVGFHAVAHPHTRAPPLFEAAVAHLHVVRHC
jgi:hypothetical protein